MVRTKKIRIISCCPEQRDRLCKEMGISKATFYAAVKGVTLSDLADKIRREAVENYGGVVVEKTLVYHDSERR